MAAKLPRPKAKPSPEDDARARRAEHHKDQIAELQANIQKTTRPKDAARYEQEIEQLLDGSHPFPRRLHLRPIDGRARHHPRVEVQDGSVRYIPAPKKVNP
jgi:hypothetical protein